MASGINSTFRQIGIATGIAGLGAIFSHRVRTEILSLLSGAAHVPAKAAHALADRRLAGLGVAGGLAKLPPAAQREAVHALRAGFTSGLNEIFLIGAVAHAHLRGTHPDSHPQPRLRGRRRPRPVARPSRARAPNSAEPAS